MKKAGDRSRAICPKCKEVVLTTFKYKKTDVQNGEDVISIPNLLVSECDQCGETVGVPQESFSSIKKSQMH